MLDFGEKLRKIRKSKRMTQPVLAKMLEVDRSMISAYENGTAFPKIERLITLCKILNVSADYLLGVSDVRDTDRDALTDEQNLSLREIAEQYAMLNSQIRKLQK